MFTHSNVGKPGAPDSERQRINAGVWRYHPTKEKFEVFGWGTSNPWGIDFDDRGQAFITACVTHTFGTLCKADAFIDKPGNILIPMFITTSRPSPSTYTKIMRVDRTKVEKLISGWMVR